MERVYGIGVYLVMVVRRSCDDCWYARTRCTSHSTVRGCHQSTECVECVECVE